MFRRRKRETEPDDAWADDLDPSDDEGDDDSGIEDDLDDGRDDEDSTLDDEPEDDDDRPGLSPRPDGPWDVSEVDDHERESRLDLGALLVSGVEGMELRVEVDEASGAVMAVTCVIGDAAAQIQPFAAPRSEGIWVDVRGEIKGQVSAGGGLVDEVDGPFGPELRTTVPASLPDGSTVMQPARFVGVDGPRWFLRAVFLGDAAAGGPGAAAIEDVFRQVVVVRGGEAMAPGDPLPLTVPRGPAGEDEAVDDDGTDGPAWSSDEVSPFRRGPEITEVR